MITTYQLFRAFWLLARYRFGSTSLDEALKGAIGTLKGQREDDLKQRVHQFYHDQVSHQIRDGAYHALQYHRTRGHFCYLMTSASSYLSELVTSDLNLDGMLAQRFEVSHGIFTGQPLEGLCFGAGKLEHAHRLLKQSSIDLSDCYFYTDSFSDLPLLQAVGYPRVVHPDRKLLRYALTHSWDIYHW